MVPYNSFLSFVQQSVEKGFCADIFLSNSQCSLLTSWRDSRNLVCTKEKVISGVPQGLDVPLPRIVVVTALSACSKATRWSNLPGGEGTGSLWRARCLARSHFPVFVREGPFFLFLFLRNLVEPPLCARACAGCFPIRSIWERASESLALRWSQRLAVSVTVADAAGAPPRSLLTSRAAKAQWGECWLLLAHCCLLPSSLYRHRTD